MTKYPHPGQWRVGVNGGGHFGGRCVDGEGLEGCRVWEAQVEVD
jgi:hypothetical protein